MDLGMQILYFVRCGKIDLEPLRPEIQKSLGKQSPVFYYLDQKGCDLNTVITGLHKHNDKEIIASGRVS